MGPLLETVALFCLKLAHETEGQSPILRDDLVMSDYQIEEFELLLRRGDVEGIKRKVEDCLALALTSLGGPEKPLGRELQKLAADFREAQTIEQLQTPLTAIKDYLRDIQ